MNSPEVTSRQVKVAEEHRSQRMSSFMEKEVQEHDREGEQEHLQRMNARRAMPRVPGFPSN
ncbi:MAG: hypothetical protein ACYC6N_04325 [Pirellulaceae bacterium]